MAKTGRVGKVKGVGQRKDILYRVQENHAKTRKEREKIDPHLYDVYEAGKMREGRE